MKQLKFKPRFVQLILNGSKTTTWRLFDDKDLKTGDEVEFLDSDSLKVIATAALVDVKAKKISEITPEDRLGHEPVGEGDALLKHYETLYGKQVSRQEIIKIIKFKLKTAS